MEMNEILNGLSCDFNEGTNDNSCNNGCGFGSWIWILLILFYSRGTGSRCCEEVKAVDSCGGTKCSSYLFLLIILFLSNACSNNNFLNGSFFN